MNLRLSILKLRQSRLWSPIKYTCALLYSIGLIMLVVHVFNNNNDIIVPLGQVLIKNDILETIVPDPHELLDFEAKVRPELGLNGAGVSLPKEQSHADIQNQMKLHSFNKFVSDVISLKRSLPDVRHPDCKSIAYDKPANLPTATVILIFSNEALSAVLRTVWSCILTSPKEMLKEIVLVDDGSTSEEISKVLPIYIKHRLSGPGFPMIKLRVLPKQIGLVGARLAGAEWSTSEIIVFLDAHCEATPGTYCFFKKITIL